VRDGALRPVLTEYRASAGEAFWDEHWGSQSIESLLSTARRSPLTALITRALPAVGAILEAGCGKGQYVMLLRERGWHVIGADQVLRPLAACRSVAPVPLAAMKLEALAVRDGALAGYVSLGAVEHDSQGPDAILAEARRTLGAGGVLVLSVPYVNGWRRLATPWLRRRSEAARLRGDQFYQYLFTRRELLAALARHGFRLVSSAPYDPARPLRRLLPSGLARRFATPPAAGAAAAAGVSTRPGTGGMRTRTVDAARRLLYSDPALRLLGHMLLVVARKE
jgi:SAM-dependent methyltransferase